MQSVFTLLSSKSLSMYFVKFLFIVFLPFTGSKPLVEFEVGWSFKKLLLRTVPARPPALPCYTNVNLFNLFLALGSKEACQLVHF